MNTLEKELDRVKAELGYYEELHEREPDRKLNAVIKALKVRLATLEDVAVTL